MEYVFRIVEVRYWQPYTCPLKNVFPPPLASPLKKAGAATAPNTNFMYALQALFDRSCDKSSDIRKYC